MSYFKLSHKNAIEEMGNGMRRQILGHESNLMLVKVYFDKGVVSPRHNHPHQQVSTVLSGEFEVEVDGEKQRLAAGDAFVIPGGLKHQASCLKAGILLDAFSPRRDDFLD